MDSPKTYTNFNYHGVFLKTDVFYKPGNEIVTSLPLQMALYFNIVFLPFWFSVMLTMLYLKYECLTNLFQFIVVAAFITVVCIECLRLYLGYVGNLSEKIPELAGFWMLSFLLQLPLQLFLLVNEGARPSGVERAVQGVECCLLAAQLSTGFVALRSMAAHQAKKFHLTQFLMTPASTGDDTDEGQHQPQPHQPQQQHQQEDNQQQQQHQQQIQQQRQEEREQVDSRRKDD